jgi:hypothetical protein
LQGLRNSKQEGYAVTLAVTARKLMALRAGWLVCESGVISLVVIVSMLIIKKL